MIPGGHQRVLGNHLLPELFIPSAWKAIARHVGLTAQQCRVARLICRGLGNKAIAKGLGVTSDAISMHNRALYEKLRISSRIGVAVRLVLAERELARAQEM